MADGSEICWMLDRMLGWMDCWRIGLDDSWDLGNFCGVSADLLGTETGNGIGME